MNITRYSVGNLASITPGVLTIPGRFPGTHFRRGRSRSPRQCCVCLGLNSALLRYWTHNQSCLPDGSQACEPCATYAHGNLHLLPKPMSYTYFCYRGPCRILIFSCNKCFMFISTSMYLPVKLFTVACLFTCNLFSSGGDSSLRSRETRRPGPTLLQELQVGQRLPQFQEALYVRWQVWQILH